MWRTYSRLVEIGIRDNQVRVLNLIDHFFPNICNNHLPASRGVGNCLFSPFDSLGRDLVILHAILCRRFWRPRRCHWCLRLALGGCCGCSSCLDRLVSLVNRLVSVLLVAVEILDKLLHRGNGVVAGVMPARGVLLLRHCSAGCYGRSVRQGSLSAMRRGWRRRGSRETAKGKFT
jgi:hypothetical protein